MIKKINIFFLPLITFLSVFFIYGCFSSPSKRYFDINMGPVNENIPNSTKKILIKDVRVSDFYDDYRLVYRKSQFELNYYLYDFWSLKPGKLIKKAMVEYKMANSQFDFIDDLSGVDPEYYVVLKLNSLEEVKKINRLYGRLAMSLSLYSFKSGKKLLYYDFDKSEGFRENKVDYFPVVISNLLKRHIAVFINKIKIMEAKNDKKN